MRILIASLTIVFLSACGTSQTDQMSKAEPLAKQDESNVMMDKMASTESSANMATANSNMENANNSVEDLKVEESNSDVVAESASDNGMIKETGIQSENSQMNEDKPMESMEGEQQDVAKEKESTEKKIVEEKG